MGEEKIPKELGVARISVKIFLTQLADILNEPDLKNVDPSTTVFAGEVDSLDAAGNITVNIDEKDKKQGAIKINTLLEEVSHFAHNQINDDVAEYNVKAGAEVPKDSTERKEAIRSLMSDKNMIEFFAKLCALQLLTRSEIKGILKKLLRKPDHDEKMASYIEHLCKFAYDQEITECQKIVKDEENALHQMEYMEAYALITNIPRETVGSADLSELARLSFEGLRVWAYNAVENAHRGRSKQIQDRYAKLEKDYIDSGLWEYGQHRDRS